MHSYTCCGIPGLAIPFYVAIQVGLLAFVYYKAEQYGMDAMLWLVLVFIFGPVAFGLFLLLILFQTRGPRRLEREGMPPGRVKYKRKAEYMSLPSQPLPAATDDFYDERLERLIQDGRLSEAREYLRDMIQVAREMKDEAALRHYSRYEPKINKAAMDNTKKPKDFLR